MRLSTIFVYMCFTLTSAYPVSSAHSHPSHAVDVSSRGLFSTAMKKVGKCFSGDASVRQHSSASSHRTTTLSFHQDHSVSSPGRGSSPSMHGSSSTSTPSLAASPERDPLHEAAKGRIRQQIPGANAPLISSTSESPKNIRWMKQLNLRPTSKPYKFDSSSTSPSSATSTTSYQASPSKGKETLLGSASRTSSGGSSSGGGLFNVPEILTPRSSKKVGAYSSSVAARASGSGHTGSAPSSPSHHDAVSHQNPASPPARTPSPSGSRPVSPSARPLSPVRIATSEQIPKSDNPASRKRLRKQSAGDNKPIFGENIPIHKSPDLRWMKKLNYHPAPRPFELHTPSSSSSSSSSYSPPASPVPSSPSHSISSATPPGTPTDSQGRGKKARVASPARTSSSSSSSSGGGFYDRPGPSGTKNH
ncbi:unnamed protein product [Sympodiomycopsis kandeliae]